MTNKRFSYKDWEDVNYSEHCFYDGDEPLDDKEVLDLLNQLNDENEQLRQELNDCEKFRHSVFKRMNELTDQLKEKEEDEKLYAEEILKLREINQFNELGGDY